MASTFAAFALALLVSAAALAAQSGTNTALSGRWTGELNADGQSRSVVLELEFDNQNNVTGTFTGLPRPGDVKEGTFDRKTGALKLALGIEGDPTVRLTLDGKVEGTKATGRISGEATGDFTLTRSEKQKH